MRARRFQTWITQLVAANLPPDIQTRPWAGTGIGDDPGVGAHTFGLVFVSPAGGTIYLPWVHSSPPGGDKPDQPENVVERSAPDPVAVPALAPRDGRIHLRDLEQWLKAVITNSGSREIHRVEAYSDRAAQERSSHPYGLSVHWHNGAAAYGFPRYTLGRGEQRRTENQWRILEAV